MNARRRQVCYLPKRPIKNDPMTHIIKAGAHRADISGAATAYAKIAAGMPKRNKAFNVFSMFIMSALMPANTRIEGKL
jgi:hypothetical protein